MRGRVLGVVLGCVLCVVVLAGVLVGVQRRNAKRVRGLGLGGKDEDQDDAGYKSWGKRRPLKEQVGRMPLPYSDVTISKVAYGSLHFAEFAGDMGRLYDVLDTALRTGITTLDVADVYGHYSDGHGHVNDMLAKAFRERPDLRNRLELIAKFGIRLDGGYRVDTSPQWIWESVGRYLSQFNTDHLDVLMIHNPDPHMDHNGVASTFKALKDQGKVKAFGISNFRKWEYEPLRDALEHHGVRLSVHEMEASVLHPERLDDGTIDYFTRGEERNKCLVMAWGPLGGEPNGGTNRLFNSTGARERRIVDKLIEVGSRLGNGATPDQVAIAWLTHGRENELVPIIGTTKAERLVSQGLHMKHMSLTVDHEKDLSSALHW